MKSHLKRGLVVALLAIPLLLIASCSKKDKGTNPDTSGAPTLTFPQFSQTVNFVGNSSLQAAKDKVNAQIALVNPWLATPKAIATALNAGQWGAKANGCWSKSSAQSNCTTTFKLCDSTGGTYDWNRTLNGNCSGVDHANWVDADGNRNADGGSGLIHAYKNNSTDVDSTWTWSTAGDQNSKNWKVYAGAEAPGNMVAQLLWTKGAGNSGNWTFQQMGTFSLAAGASSVPEAKWTLTASSDSKTGTMDIYAWSAGTTAGTQSFWRSDHIAWNPDSSGTWIEYGQQGNVVTEHHWPQTGPNIVIPDVGHDIFIADSMNTCAMEAKATAAAPIYLAQTFAAIGKSFFGVLDTVHMGNQVNGCWNWQYAVGSCSEAYSLCQTSGGYNWGWTEDGSCTGQTFNHWKAAEGTISNDGLSGAITIYMPNSTTIQTVWSWSTATDGKSGTWSVYNGPVSDSNLTQSLNWSEGTDGSTDATWQIFGAYPMKTTTHESADGTSGTSTMSMWNPETSSFYTQTAVQWNADGTGSDTMYNPDGTVATSCTWP